MKKFRLILTIFLIIFVLFAAALAVFNFLVPKASGILIETSPASTVYINGEEVGRTPYQSFRKAEEITLRLIPDTFGQPLPAFEEKINLVSGTETVVRRYFGVSDVYSEGEVLSFEKLYTADLPAMSVISDPENVQVEIDSVSSGVTPFTSSSIAKGTHIVKFSASGYKDRSINIDLKSGYKLVAFVKLAKTDEQTPVIEDDKGNLMEKMVRILKTPTGFLRVREDASTSAKEIAQVKPGDEYPLIEEDNSGFWFKIDTKQGVLGWVTSQYAEIFEKDASATESSKLL